MSSGDFDENAIFWGIAEKQASGSDFGGSDSFTGIDLYVVFYSVIYMIIEMVRSYSLCPFSIDLTPAMNGS